MNAATKLPDPGAITCADDVERVLAPLYGGVPSASPGVLHVTAVAQRPDGWLTTLTVDPATPPPLLDTLVLGAARARADAIVTTGKILRDEPALQHDPPGPKPMADALAAWRKRLGKSRPPVSVVLTSGRDLDLEHPLFHGSTRPIVYTSLEGAQALRSAAATHGVGIIADASPSLRGAVSRLRGQGLETLLIEAGPSSSTDLYASPCRVDELLLSVRHVEHLPAEHAVGAFLPSHALASWRSTGPTPLHPAGTADGWQFLRLLPPAH